MKGEEGILVKYHYFVKNWTSFAMVRSSRFINEKFHMVYM